MRFDNGLVPENYGLRLLWLALAALLLALCFATITNANTVLPLAAALLASRTPVATASLAATSTPSLTPGPLITPSPTASVTPPPTQTSLPTDTQSPAEPAPTATWFYVIPAQPTPIPTPVLPAAAPFPTACDGPGRMNILLLGIDGFNNNYQRAARADTVILVGVNFADRTAHMLSFPRDLWVTLPNLLQVGEARLNSAYHYGELYGAPGGGPGETSAVLANTFGLRVDRFVVVNFTAFERGIDAIGGIDITIPAAIHDPRYPLRDGSGTIAIDFPAGPVHMDGATALIYARIRHDSSDFQRMRRQQQVLMAVRQRLLSPETLPHLPALAQVLLGAARTNLTLDDLALLGCLAPQIGDGAIRTWVIGESQVTHTRLADGAQVLLPRMEQIVPILEEFNVGE